MIRFMHRDDIPKARLPTHLATFIENILTDIIRVKPAFDPENDGFIVLVTPNDTDETLSIELGVRWSDSSFDGVAFDKSARIFHVVILNNNQFAISVIIPDEVWLDSGIRERVVNNTG